MIFIYVTAKEEVEAQKIARHLLGKKLIACANYFPIRSTYWWKEELMDDREFVLILKTEDKNYEEIKEEITSMHSYAVPCITKIPVLPNDTYGAWLQEQLK